jgi:hypothetical protein
MLPADGGDVQLHPVGGAGPTGHPLRSIRRITDRALERLSPHFGTVYVNFGRPSIPPEQLLRAMLLQALYTIRSASRAQPEIECVQTSHAHTSQGKRNIVSSWEEMFALWSVFRLTRVA